MNSACQLHMACTYMATIQSEKTQWRVKQIVCSLLKIFLHDVVVFVPSSIVASPISIPEATLSCEFTVTFPVAVGAIATGAALGAAWEYFTDDE